MYTYLLFVTRRFFWLACLLICGSISFQLVHAQTASAQQMHETQQVIAASQRLNINEADQQQLMALPGVGATRAAAIIRLREERGGFTDAQQLLEVHGIGRATLARLEPLISF